MIPFFLVAVFFVCVIAEYDIGFGDDSDLTTFVTRPEIRAPRFNVTVYDADRVDAGYWFVGVYADIVQQTQARAYYQPCQTGPHIFDGEGQLVWSGACQFVNQNACSFRPYQWNGSFYLTGILNFYKGINDARGRGIILDNAYDTVDNIYSPPKAAAFNMHEFVVTDDGNRAIFITTRPEVADFTDFEGVSNPELGWILNAGFQEWDRTTQKTVFEWWAYPNVGLHEANVTVPEDMDAYTAWNFFHPNSVDKNAEGDYLFSSRYTNCVYKISGVDGSILWRLGGVDSNFQLQGFNFSRQHDARWIKSTADKDVISLLDNGGDTDLQTSNQTTGLIITLDKTDMVAKVVKQWVRPGGRFSALRGNFQVLDSGNVFGGWSDNCHISEHSDDGQLLMEAEFASKRFVTYRAYKGNFTSNPPTKPDVKAFAYGFGGSSSVTVYYASWNGATEVASWRFLRQTETGLEEIGSAKRTGFETRFQSLGFVDQDILAEAVDRDGTVLRRSEPVRIEAFFGEMKVSDNEDETFPPRTEL